MTETENHATRLLDAVIVAAVRDGARVDLNRLRVESPDRQPLTDTAADRETVLRYALAQGLDADHVASATGGLMLAGLVGIFTCKKTGATHWVATVPSGARARWSLRLAVMSASSLQRPDAG